MVVNNIEIFQKMKKKGQLSIEKIIPECKKIPDHVKIKTS